MLFIISILLIFVYVAEAQNDPTKNPVSANNLELVENQNNPLLGTCSDGIIQAAGFAKEDKKLRGVADLSNTELPKMNVIENPNLKRISSSSVENVLKENLMFSPGDVVGEDTGQAILTPCEYTVFEINTVDNSVEFISNTYELAEECYIAIEQTPLWLREQLTVKFRVLQIYKLADDYAQLIIDADEKIKDEVAFQVANISKQELYLNIQLRNDKELIIRNAEMIYKTADSLHYVKLVEHGDYESKDYYTTTTYRVIDTLTSDTIWVEAPRDIYYWYIVHPKLRQEKIRATDDTTSEQQRTYDYFWRDYYWSNPNAEYDSLENHQV
ncbi:MAG: hypothetical protein B6247_29050 [Candidatus Parabeggiatoa sp. nov. 2]|nr:MAG: hypothetical protein B6247_29050 [Beggiatoa sp. 4572_84]